MKRFGDSTPASIFVHSPLVELESAGEESVSLGEEGLLAVQACAVGAGWECSVWGLPDSRVGCVSGSVHVSSGAVLGGVSVVLLGTLDGSVSKTVVGAGVVKGVVGGHVRAGVVRVAVVSVSVVHGEHWGALEEKWLLLEEEWGLLEEEFWLWGKDGVGDVSHGASVGIAPFGISFGSNFNGVDVGESEEGSGECEFHCVV